MHKKNNENKLSLEKGVVESTEITMENIVKVIKNAGYEIHFDDDGYTYLKKRGVNYLVLCGNDNKRIVYLGRLYQLSKEDLEIVTATAAATNQVIDLGKVLINQISDDDYCIEYAVTNIYSSVKELECDLPMHLKAVDDDYNIHQFITDRFTSKMGLKRKISITKAFKKPQKIK